MATKKVKCETLKVGDKFKFDDTPVLVVTYVSVMGNVEAVVADGSDPYVEEFDHSLKVTKVEAE